MNLKQLIIIDNVVKLNFNLTKVAKKLFTSQPAVSKSISDLEEELGGMLFIRRGRKINGLTEQGEQFYNVCNIIIEQINNIKTISQDWRSNSQGRLLIATTHTQARYTLPSVLNKFRELFPNVKLAIHQGNPEQLYTYLLREEADIAIASEGLAKKNGLEAWPLYQWQHLLVTTSDHHLYTKSRHQTVTLNDLSLCPLIAFDLAFAGRSKINRAFELAGLSYNVVLEAMDADVIKTYVRNNMGVGIMPQVAFDEQMDSPLCAIPAEHLFGINTTWMAIKEKKIQRKYVYDFIKIANATLKK